MRNWKKIALHLFAIPVLVLSVYVYLKPGKVKLDPIDYGQLGQPKYASMVRISTDKGICTAFVISKNYALTAGHCVVGQLGDKYKIYGQLLSDPKANAKYVNKAIAARVTAYGGIDLGLLKGNFNDFYYAPIVQDDVQFMPIFVSCGFGGGALSPMCRVLVQPQPAGFIAAAIGNLLPGMSGGPVIDPFSGKVVGINSAQLDGIAFFTPTTKALDFLGLTGDVEGQE